MKMQGTNLIQPIQFTDDQGKVITPSNLKTYLLLIYYRDDEGNEQRTFEVITGRKFVVQRILDYAVEYNDTVNNFKSMVISESVTMDQAISFYSFVRLCLENNKLTDEEWQEVALENGDEIFDLEAWDNYQIEMCSEYLQDLPASEVVDSWENRMADFYKADTQAE